VDVCHTGFDHELQQCRPAARKPAYDDMPSQPAAAEPAALGQLDEESPRGKQQALRKLRRRAQLADVLRRRRANRGSRCRREWSATACTAPMPDLREPVRWVPRSMQPAARR
jgi:hypothetical protein